MPSEELELLIAGYVLGDLDDSERVEFEQMLAENPAIGATVAQMQNALELAYAPPEMAPPAHLRSTILAASHLAPVPSVPVPSESIEPQPIRAQSPPPTSPFPTQATATSPPATINRSVFSWQKAWSVAHWGSTTIASGKLCKPVKRLNLQAG